MKKQNFGSMLLAVVLVLIIAVMFTALREVVWYILPFIGLAAVIFMIYLIFWDKE